MSKGKGNMNAPTPKSLRGPQPQGPRMAPSAQAKVTVPSGKSSS
jgi:hypothetical protein